MRTLRTAAEIAGLEQRIRAVNADDQGLWGVMTAGQMVCHLRGAFRVAMGEIACEAIRMPIPRGAVKVLALRVPLRWGKNIPTVPPLKVGTAVMEASGFDVDREEAIAAMMAFVRPEQARGDHAFFGRMSYADWMRWGYLHTDHHLRQFGR